MSLMMVLTRSMPATMSCMVSPARPARVEPSVTRPVESSIRTLISLAADAERWASARTSPATTAKPRPCSPARAASTAAFSARILVWNAMPSMTPMMSAMRAEDSLIAPMVSTSWPTILPPCWATREACAASVLACSALSALCWMPAVSSSIEDAVSSSEAAWLSVRRDSSCASPDSTAIDSPMAPVP